MFVSFWKVCIFTKTPLKKFRLFNKTRLKKLLMLEIIVFIEIQIKVILCWNEKWRSSWLPGKTAPTASRWVSKSAVSVAKPFPCRSLLKKTMKMSYILFFANPDYLGIFGKKAFWNDRYCKCNRAVEAWAKYFMRGSFSTQRLVVYLLIVDA